MYEEMIVTGAWWDYVDHIAGRRIGLLLRNHPAPMSRLMRRWSRSDDMWKRRTSIICQLGFKERTDLALLYDCIEPNLDDREFFIRKAIGWALRQHAWTDPKEVQRYVRAHEDQLSGLSRREALKNRAVACCSSALIARTQLLRGPPRALEQRRNQRHHVGRGGHIRPDAIHAAARNRAQPQRTARPFEQRHVEQHRADRPPRDAAHHHHVQQRDQREHGEDREAGPRAAAPPR